MKMAREGRTLKNRYPQNGNIINPNYIKPWSR